MQAKTKSSTRGMALSIKKLSRCQLILSFDFRTATSLLGLPLPRRHNLYSKSAGSRDVTAQNLLRQHERLDAG